MPIYEYECEVCHRHRELIDACIQGDKNFNPRVYCSSCEKFTMRRIPSVPGGRYRFMDKHPSNKEGD